VNSCKVNGTKFTKKKLIEKQLNSLFQAKTLKEILEETETICGKLNRFGIFNDLGVNLDVPKSKILDNENEVDIIINLKEKPRFWARTGTEVGNNEGNLNASLNLRNPFGTGETFEANASYGLCYSSPINGNPDRVFQTFASQKNMSHKIYSSFNEFSNNIGFKFRKISPFGSSEYGYVASWRQINQIGKDASFSVRSEAGNSFKSSLYYRYIKDTRNDQMLPSRGALFKFYQELAGLGGDVQFVKHEAETQWNIPLGKGFVSLRINIFFLIIRISLSSSLRGGLLLPLMNSRTRINDRFFIGGPLSVRGFNYFGLGPKDGKDVIGGDTYWSTGLSLYAPLPRLADKPIKTHMFVNAGSSILLNQKESLSENVNRLIRTPSISTGFGLAVKFSILRVELNYCLPVAITKTDDVKKGLQFGVGLNFM
ncbi:hypothetical protein PIROE2DRAFT_46898, partial [Piromyces sp. E2]